MPITGIGLAFTLAGALSWAMFDALRKGLARVVSPVHLGLLLPLAQAPLLALWAATREPFGLAAACLPPLAATLREPGVRRMALVALLWGGTSVLDQTAVSLGAGAWYAPVVTAAVAALMLLWAALRGQVRAFLAAARPLAARPLLAGTAVVIGAVALAVQIEAFRWAPVGFIEVVKRGTGMASAVVLGRFVFGEPLNGRKGLAVVLLTLGVALVVGLR